MSVDQRLSKVFSEVFELSPEEVSDEASPKTIERWDSMNSMVLAMALEEEFEVQFSDQELIRMNSYRSIRETLAQKGS
ncbi:MAG: acyl carrier protein [Verrucomicrobia bacterium]|nr:acyl carrier protein [Verrucomicrobiota bacterium]